MSINEKYEEYLQRREELIRLKSSETQNVDNRITVLSLLGIVFVLTFHKSIGVSVNNIIVWLMSIALLANFIGHVFACMNAEKKIKENDRVFAKYQDINKVPEKQFWTKKAVKICNIISQEACFFGMVGVLGGVMEMLK